MCSRWNPSPLWASLSSAGVDELCHRLEVRVDHLGERFDARNERLKLAPSAERSPTLALLYR